MPAVSGGGRFWAYNCYNHCTRASDISQRADFIVSTAWDLWSRAGSSWRNWRQRTTKSPSSCSRKPSEALPSDRSASDGVLRLAPSERPKASPIRPNRSGKISCHSHRNPSPQRRSTGACGTWSPPMKRHILERREPPAFRRGSKELSSRFAGLKSDHLRDAVSCQRGTQARTTYL